MIRIMLKMREHVISKRLAQDILKIWLNYSFEERERFELLVNKIIKIEEITGHNKNSGLIPAVFYTFS